MKTAYSIANLQFASDYLKYKRKHILMLHYRNQLLYEYVEFRFGNTIANWLRLNRIIAVLWFNYEWLVK